MENVAEDIVSESLGGGGADMGQDIPKMPFPGGAGNFKMPSMEDFIKMLEHMENLSDEEKEQLKQDVLKNSMNSMGGRKMEAGFSDYLVFLTMVVIIASVFVFFGYKLYLSLTEQERKREEKQKAKEAKKKK